VKYVERNPVRAKLTERCEDWEWGSAWRRVHGTEKQKKLLAPPLVPFPNKYIQWINTDDKKDEIAELRNSVKKGVPYGEEKWVNQVVEKYQLSSTLRKPGRQKKIY
jgi:putative transposase